ncbi:HNH endonuclease signature motif containing protein [Nocardioides caldifontis]|uniref:HNH endonuclease signature motif containing protein n=1 Tax=Nocardioides caldifontis TaxID=2588938 RepID=UPI0011DFB77C|nr:HNH endonuclease signature motif containing protein [Nocardioides caldifontis]
MAAEVDPSPVGEPDDPSGRTPVAARADRVHWFVGRLHEVLDDLTAGGVAVATMSQEASAETVEDLLGAAERVKALALQVLAHADRIDVAELTGATSTHAWLAQTSRLSLGEAKRLVRLARRLDTAAFDTTASATLAGRVDLAQAQVVVDAVVGLPAGVGANDRARAERHLLALAAHHHAKELKLLGRHLHQVVDPDGADEELARELEREEAEAARRTVLRIGDDGQGSCHGQFRIPTVYGAMLVSALQALASPKRPDPIRREAPAGEGGEGGEEVVVEQRGTPEVMGEAFCQLLSRFPTKRLPKAGRMNATVVVTMELDTLLGGLRPAVLSTGQELSASQARLLACQAGVVPAVLGGDGQLLDLGRRRYFSSTQSLALAVRDRGCTVHGCTVPAAWCHAHHDVPWSQGGATDLANGRLLCPRHHTRVHSGRYDLEKAGTRTIRLVRRL